MIASHRRLRERLAAASRTVRYWLVRGVGLSCGLFLLLAVVFACLNFVPRASHALLTEANFAAERQREAEREVLQSVREERPLPVFFGWPAVDRHGLVATAIAYVQDPRQRELGIAWLRWLGAVARTEWPRDPVVEVPAEVARAFADVGLPADARRYAPEVVEARCAAALDALFAGDRRAADEITELGTLLLEPLAYELQRDESQRPAQELERAFEFLRTLPQVELGRSADLARDRAQFLQWWDRHALYFERSDTHTSLLRAISHTRFSRWLRRFSSGDWGRDRDGRSIRLEVFWRLKTTLPLAAAALLLSFGAALPCSHWLATRLQRGSGRWLERGLLCLHCAPGFWIALLLLSLFASGGPLSCFPGSWSSRAVPDGAWAQFVHTCERAFLPVLALALPAFAFLVRQRCAALLDAMHAPFSRAARMKGLSDRAVLLAHAAPHARFVMWTMVGAAFPALVSGSVMVETLFDIPGVGRYALDGLLARDLPRVLALTALAGVATWMGLEVAEAGLRVADPRRRSSLQAPREAHARTR